MVFRSLLLTVSLLASVPAFTQGAEKAAQNASNWDIFQKLYPPRAIKAREEGAVGFLVTIDAKGAVTQCQVTHSSGHPLLDPETCKIITLNAEFQPEPGLSASQVRTREGVITWKLADSKTALNAPRPVAANAAPEKMICKKSIRTGTVAGAERTCMTAVEWSRLSDAERASFEEIRNKGFTRGN
jgi:TonB family protein